MFSKLTAEKSLKSQDVNSQYQSNEILLTSVDVQKRVKKNE